MYCKIAVVLSFMTAHFCALAKADELYCPNLLANDKDVASLLAFNANDFCNALVEGFNIPTSPCMGGHVSDASGWMVEITRETLGYHNNYSLSLIGPSERLDGYVPSGFEKYKLQLVVFIGLNCRAAYYSVITSAMYHTGNFSEARKEGDSNWKVFMPNDIAMRGNVIMDYVGDYVRKKFK